MLRAPDHIASYLSPINAAIDLLVHQSANNYVVSAHQIQAVWLLHRRLLVILWSDDALHSVLQHNIGDLVATYQCARERSAVDGDNQNFLCKYRGALALSHGCKPGRAEHEL